MNLVPWDYWADDGEPRGETAELVEALEAVLERDPYHPAPTISTSTPWRTRRRRSAPRVPRTGLPS
jgi:hypothetical protein